MPAPPDRAARPPRGDVRVAMAGEATTTVSARTRDHTPGGRSRNGSGQARYLPVTADCSLVRRCPLEGRAAAGSVHSEATEPALMRRRTWEVAGWSWHVTDAGRAGGDVTHGPPRALRHAAQRRRAAHGSRPQRRLAGARRHAATGLYRDGERRPVLTQGEDGPGHQGRRAGAPPATTRPSGRPGGCAGAARTARSSSPAGPAPRTASSAGATRPAPAGCCAGICRRSQLAATGASRINHRRGTLALLAQHPVPVAARHPGSSLRTARAPSTWPPSATAWSAGRRSR